MKKIFAFLLTVMLVVILSTNAFATQYPNDSSWLGDETKDAFYDVTNDKWYAEYANEAFYRGLFEGTYPNEYVRVFLPDDMFTREQAVALLYRIDQGGFVPHGTYETGFDDAQSNAWYAYHVYWAKEHGITTGITDSLFGVGNPITREELATLVARYVNFKGVSLKDAEDVTEAYADADDVSEWAKDAVELMRKSGILMGDENGNVRPRDVITRAEAAAMLVRVDSALVFEMSDLLDFDDDTVASVKFSYQNNSSDRGEVNVTDSAEIKEILKNLRSMTIVDSKSTGMLTGGGKSIIIYDENGESLFSALFTADSLLIGDYSYHRYLYLDSAYMKEYYDIFEMNGG